MLVLDGSAHSAWVWKHAFLCQWGENDSGAPGRLGAKWEISESESYVRPPMPEQILRPPKASAASYGYDKHRPLFQGDYSL